MKPSTLAVALLLIFPSVFAGVLGESVSQSFQVDSCSTRNISLELNSGEKVLGSFTITGTSYFFANRRLNFRVLDNTVPGPSVYSLPVVLDLGTVINQTSFKFTAGSAGIYLLVFDNTINCGPYGQKTVQLVYENDNGTSNPAGVSNVPATTALTASVFAGIGIVSFLGITGFFLYRQGYRVRKVANPSVTYGPISGERRRWRTNPSGGKVLVLVQFGIITLLSVWLYEEYLNNAFLRAYLQGVLESGLLPILSFALGALAVVALALYAVLHSRRKRR